MGPFIVVVPCCVCGLSNAHEWKEILVLVVGL